VGGDSPEAGSAAQAHSFIAIRLMQREQSQAGCGATAMTMKVGGSSSQS
jgi:hypothetical protein